MDKGIEKREITQPRKKVFARGRPGVDPRWTSGAKTLVGTAQASESRVWFTINDGVLAEIYHPDVDQANTRVLRFLITGPDEFFSDELWDADHEVSWLARGAPGARVDTRCKQGRYTLTKEIVPDPQRDVLLLRVRFTPSAGEDLRLFVTADVHVGDIGTDNRAWAGEYKGVPMLFGARGQVAVALAADPPFSQMSVGFVGKTDGFTVLSRHEPLPPANMAQTGNVALTAELDLKTPARHSGEDGSFVVVLGCGGDATEAGQQARAGLLQDFGGTRALFLQQWSERQAEYLPVADLSGSHLDLYRVSTAMLETHQSKRFPGGFVASLSLPWGWVRSDRDVGGYHVVWPRDLVQTAMGKLASGDVRSARSTLFYLACTQDADGGWSQNMWLDGTPHWSAVQMDGIALPILLADRLLREDVLDGYDPRPLMHAAGCFVLKHGPVTEQDRWETTPGFSPYTMAVQVAALLAAADCADGRGAPEQGEFLRQTADAWNDAIDEMTYVQGTPLAQQHGVPGYYLRMAPPERIERAEIGGLRIRMPNRPFGRRHPHAIEVVSPDALALVRFGLRAADDPRILDTVRVIDATLKQDTVTGPGWRRSTFDGYGEKADGKPFLKTGIGRSWPLLCGERGMYEISAGNREAALDLLQTMGRQSSECGLLPEQVWDAEDIPERELFNGRPSGSGMPLVWAHAEYIKLLRSLHENAIWDAVPQTRARYIEAAHPATFQIWRPTQRRGFVTAGKDLRVDLDGSARVTWKLDGNVETAETMDSGLGIHFALLPLRQARPGSAIRVQIEPHRGSAGCQADAFIVRIRESHAEQA